MIDFQKILPQQREKYLPYLLHAAHRGCFCDFGNLCMWGEQNAAILGSHMLLLSRFNGRTLYPFPIGTGDVQPALDAIMLDAKERGIPCRITSMTQQEAGILESCYPGLFSFHYERDSFDYVYDIHDLADLKGRKYQQKRNHLHRFEEAHPDFTVKELDDTSLPDFRAVAERWYDLRAAENPEEDLSGEKIALERAFADYRALAMEGLVLYAGGDAVAMTMASPLGDDTLDVHFEKAFSGIHGAYAAINREFARYIREKHPHIQFLNREEDTGSEGLRQAKLSYHPHHMVEKCWALPKSEEPND